MNRGDKVSETPVKKRDRPQKSDSVEINSSQQSKEYEFNSYNSIFTNIFGTNFFNTYNIKQVTEYVKNPMLHNNEIRELSLFAYNSSGIVTNTIDYMISLPTLDKVIVKRGRNKSKTEKNKSKMLLALDVFTCIRI